MMCDKNGGNEILVFLPADFDPDLSDKWTYLSLGTSLGTFTSVA